MSDIRQQYGMKIITEAIDNESLDLVDEYANVIQIEAHNMENFSLLKRAGRAKKPVLLEARHVSNSGRIFDGRGIHSE